MWWFFSTFVNKIPKTGKREAGAFFSCGAMTNIGSIGALVVFHFLGEEAFALVPLYKIFEPVIYYIIWFPIAKSFSPYIIEKESKHNKIN